MMRKKVLFPVLIVLSVLIIAVIIFCLLIRNLNGSSDKMPTGRNEAETYLLSLDTFNGAAGLDLSTRDFSDVSLEVLAQVLYDSKTLWPDASKLPKGFSPEVWLTTAKAHGAGLDNLHQAGITGKGISIAIFDKPINENHKEFSDRLVYIKTDCVGRFDVLHFHGISCASVIAGSTCGVAPEVNLFYFAVPDSTENFSNYCKAMDELIEFNRMLPQDQKIRLVSISDGLTEEGSQWEKWQTALNKAEQEGIAVNYSNELIKWDIAYGGCPPYNDINNPKNFIPEHYVKGMRIPKNLTFTPSSYRTTAANEGDDAYRYWPEGGFSWSIAYVSGLSALAYQVNPDITYEEIVDLLCETKLSDKDSFGLINPEAFIEAVKVHKSQ
ncbi:MAG: peptidase [Thermoclostridium sp.]|nr:peptidase [Thermoclostridium sp.]